MRPDQPVSNSDLSRRSFLKSTSIGGVGALSASSLISGGPDSFLAQEAKKKTAAAVETASTDVASLPKAEKLVLELYDSLSDHQKSKIVRTL